MAVRQVVLLVRGAREGGQHVAGVSSPHEQPGAGLEGASGGAGYGSMTWHRVIIVTAKVVRVAENICGVLHLANGVRTDAASHGVDVVRRTSLADHAKTANCNEFNIRYSMGGGTTFRSAGALSAFSPEGERRSLDGVVGQGGRKVRRPATRGPPTQHGAAAENGDRR